MLEPVRARAVGPLPSPGARRVQPPAAPSTRRKKKECAAGGLIQRFLKFSGPPREGRRPPKPAYFRFWMIELDVSDSFLSTFDRVLISLLRRSIAICSL